MNPDELPLLDLFNRLRDHGLPLGVEEYMAVLRAMRAGFGIEDRQALEQLCCMVWTKTEEEARILSRLLDNMLVQPTAQPDEVPSPKPAQPPAPQTPVAEEPQSAPSVSTPPTSGPMLEMDEPAQVVQAVGRSTRHGMEMLGRPRYSLLTDYFPVTRRQIKQSWRHLRRPVREGPPEELDVTATIKKVAREGFLLEPVLVPRRSNRAELVLLVDRDGSMVPFHALSRQLVETAQRGGRLGWATVYYFHDYPDDYLYRDSARLDARPIPEVLTRVDELAAVLIISDAGASRGNFDGERVERTKEFIQQLKQSVRWYAWLNPMPHYRWPGTTAGEIARIVPMFEMSRRGLDAAISALRGRYVYWERTYPWMM